MLRETHSWKTWWELFGHNREKNKLFIRLFMLLLKLLDSSLAFPSFKLFLFNIMLLAVIPQLIITITIFVIFSPFYTFRLLSTQLTSFLIIINESNISGGSTTRQWGAKWKQNERRKEEKNSLETQKSITRLRALFLHFPYLPSGENARRAEAKTPPKWKKKKKREMCEKIWRGEIQRKNSRFALIEWERARARTRQHVVRWKKSCCCKSKNREIEKKSKSSIRIASQKPFSHRVVSIKGAKSGTSRKAKEHSSGHREKEAKEVERKKCSANFTQNRAQRASGHTREGIESMDSSASREMGNSETRWMWEVKSVGNSYIYAWRRSVINSQSNSSLLFPPLLSARAQLALDFTLFSKLFPLSMVTEATMMTTRAPSRVEHSRWSEWTTLHFSPIYAFSQLDDVADDDDDDDDEERKAWLGRGEEKSEQKKKVCKEEVEKSFTI